MVTERERILINAIGGRLRDSYDETIEVLWGILNHAQDDTLRDIILMHIQDTMRKKEEDLAQTIAFAEEITEAD